MRKSSKLQTFLLSYLLRTASSHIQWPPPFKNSQHTNLHHPFQQPFHGLEKLFSWNWSWKQKRHIKMPEDPRCFITQKHLWGVSGECWGILRAMPSFLRCWFSPWQEYNSSAQHERKGKVFCISHEIIVNHYLWATRNHLWQVFCELGNRVRKGEEH